MEEFNLTPLQKTSAQKYTGYRALAQSNVEAALDIASGIYLRNFGFDADPSFDLSKRLEPRHFPYQDQLMDAQSNAEFDFIDQQIQRESNRMAIASNAPWTAHVGAAAFDVSNLLPGIVAFKSPTLLSKIANAGLTGAAFQTGIETARYFGGANFTVDRAVSSVVTSTALSAAIGGTVDLGVKTHRNFVINSHREFRDTQQQITAMENLQNRVEEFAATQREQRAHGAKEDSELSELITATERRIYGLTEGLDQARNKPNQSDDDVAFQQRLQNMLNDESSKLSEFVDEKSARLVDDATVAGVVDPYRLGEGTFNPVPSPLSKIQQLDPIGATYDGLNMLKSAALKMAGDFGRVTRGNIAGVPSNESVFIAAATERRHWAQFNRLARESYAEATGASNKTLFQFNTSSMARSVTGSGPTYRQFLVEINRKRLFGESPANDAEARTIRGMQEFYDRWRSVTEQNNQIGRTGLEAEINVLKVELARVKDKLATTDRGKDYYEERLKDTEDKIKTYESALNVVQSTPSGPKGKEPYFNRIFDVVRIKANPERFKSIIYENFVNRGSIPFYNAETKLYERKSLPADPARAMEAVDDLYNQIVNDPDPLSPAEVSGLTGSVKLAHRMLDIDNRQLWDFIQQDPLEAMKNYTTKTAPKYHFSRLFNGKSPERVWNEINDQLVADGYDKAFIDEARKNFTVLENRVMSRVYRDPSRWDIQAAQFLRDFTSLNYLGTAGVASLPDFARIIMDHDVGDVFTHALKMFNTPEIRLSMKEVRDEFGEGLDIDLGAVQHRISEGLVDNVNPNGVWNNTKQVGHILNFLGPVTEFLKTFEGSLRQHTLIKYMRNVVDGRASKLEIDYLNRYGISVKMSKEIISKAPIQELSGRNLANVGEWEANGISLETVDTFRVAVNGGVLNTIVSATPADRPIASDGIVYIPTSLSKRIPWAKNIPEDEVVKGFVRVESGAMTLPFQFYSFMFASMNKVTAAYTSGQVKNRLAGAFAAVGLGYLAVMAKTPDYVWDEMSDRDKFLRAFDYSGLAALYTDLMYTSMEQSLAAGGNPIMSKYVSPKYDQEQNVLDFITGFAGAGPSTLQDIGEGSYNLLAGDSSRGAKQLYNTIPLTGTVFMKFISSQFQDAFR